MCEKFQNSTYIAVHMFNRNTTGFESCYNGISKIDQREDQSYQSYNVINAVTSKTKQSFF